MAARRIASIFAVLCPTAVFAQVGFTFNSLDLLVAQADVIVRGTIVDVGRGPAINNMVTCVVTLDVRETLKGKESKRLTLVAHQHEQGRTLEQWRDAKSDLLLFLNRRAAEKPKNEPALPTAAEQIAAHGTDLFLGALGSQKIALGPRVPDDWAPPPPIFTTEMRLLKTPDDILKTTRALVAEDRGQNPVRVHSMDMPRSVADRLGTSGDANRFYVAVDRHLETLARRLIATPMEFVPSAEEIRWKPKTDEDRKRLEADRQFSAGRLRAEGAKALAYFKSAENIAALKPLLKDDASLIEHPPAGDNAKPVRVYYVRAAAYEVLRQWGVDVEPKPVLREARE
jgi:hypothetical protein